jgi:flavodoxin
MNVLIIYDTVFGNTETIAKSIGIGMQSSAFVQVVNITNLTSTQLQQADFVVIGSPTRGFRATEGISKFVKELAPEQFTGKRIAAFDTRMDMQDIKSGMSRFIVKTGGFAADKIAKDLKKKGMQLVKEPEGFLVTGDQGSTMVAGEPERATGWGKSFL